MNEPSVPTIRKFNPGLFQSDRDVIEQFVVRHHELDAVLDVLRGNVEAPSCQHVLIVAPRGQGKTMLLARAAAELRADEQLSARLLPVRFMEESHEIFRLADFWLETLFYLAREVAGPDPDLSRELRDTHADLKSRWRERELADRARAAVLEAAERLDRRLVLMVENLQALCESVDDDFGWGLRQALQSEPRIVLVATATSRFEALEDARQPFFELFRTIPLRPLNTEDCRRLWQAAGGGDRSAWSIRPLEILTRGSPRLLVIVAGLARHRSLRQLLDELVTLIDDHTEYFRSHLEGLPRTERRVYLAVIDLWNLWELATPGEIAARAALDVRVVSTMLGRLVERDAITAEGSGRKRRYAAAGLYWIYYKLRRERDEAAVVQRLISFIARFYGDEELKKLAGPLRREAARFPVIREGMKRALADERARTEMSDMAANVFMSAVFLGEERQAVEGEDRQARESSDEALEFRSRVASASVLVDKGLDQIQHGDAEAAVKTCDEVVDRFGADEAPELRSQVALAMVNKGHAQMQLGDAGAVVRTCDEVVDRFGADETPGLRLQVVMALANKGRAQMQHGGTEAAIVSWDEAVVSWDDFIERYGADKAPKLQFHIAQVLVNKGLAQMQHGDAEAAIAACDEIIERFGTGEAPELQLHTAQALVNKGFAQGRLGDAEAAVKTCDEVVERYGADEAPRLRLQVAWVLLFKSSIQITAGHPEGALRACEELERRFDTLAPDEIPAFRWLTVWVRIDALLAMGRREAAVDAFRTAYHLFDPKNEGMMGEMLGTVPRVIAAGFPERDLVGVLAEDRGKADALAPLLVALRQRIGESIRAPVEVLEVAKDIRRLIDETKAAGNASPAS